MDIFSIRKTVNEHRLFLSISQSYEDERKMREKLFQSSESLVVLSKLHLSDSKNY
jgi:hypothetical protein